MDYFFDLVLLSNVDKTKISQDFFSYSHSMLPAHISCLAVRQADGHCLQLLPILIGISVVPDVK